MKQNVLTLFTRTPLHVGAGSSVGAIDQPVIRERHTRFPVIPGSSIKGVLRDAYTGENKDTIFGKEDFSGSISFGEARLLAFPVRSAKGCFAFAVSPLTLKRFARDADLTIEVPDAEDMKCLAGNKLIIGNKVVLEEYCFENTGAFPEAWEKELTNLLSDAVLKGAKGHFVLISDTDMSYFAENACQVAQHVRIEDETGTSKDGSLFNEETVPSETLFYSTLTSIRENEDVKKCIEGFKAEKLIQFGGKGTTGLGYCTAKIIG